MSKKDKFLIREALEEIDLDAISKEYENPEKMKKRFIKKEKRGKIEALLKSDFIIEGEYTINDDLTVSVDGDVYWNSNKPKLSVTFSEVTGKFDCSSSNLESLEGAPKKVKEFDCGYNKNLTSLEEGPEEAMYYDCSGCNLLSLKGAPKKVKVFNCTRNENLTSLEGGPVEVEKYYCYKCNLLSLKGAPKKVKRFDCKYNKNLTSLEGGPEEAEEYYCFNCNLLSLKGAPKKVKEFDFSDNPIHDKLKKEGKL